MPLTEIERLDRDKANPRVVALHLAMQRLRSVVSFMHSGAHPDDESSAMLAVLGFRDGLDLSFVCANRGEGGQNDIGTESQATLGTLRTAEMEAAADVLDLRLYWLSQSPDDSIFDFGFSKSGEETLAHWQNDRTLERFVTAVRRERPDIICPTFLDIPGQHGHHRAMTAMAFEVMNSAADADYEIEGTSPWQIKKLYLPAWSGSGYAYDDEELPPAATLTIHGEGSDPLTGWSWENIGQHSRRFHLTQNMGRWIETNAERNWPLHLADTRVEGPDDSLSSGLPENLGALANWARAPELEQSLASAQAAMDEAFDSFPEFDAIALAAANALDLIRRARNHCPPHARNEVLHRLARKEQQLSIVIRLASGVQAYAETGLERWKPGDVSPISLYLRQVSPGVKASLRLLADSPWAVANDTLTLAADAQPSNPYPDVYLPGQPALPAVELSIELDGVTSTTRLPLDIPPLILPSATAVAHPTQQLINTTTKVDSFAVRIADRSPEDASVSISLPEGWASETTSTGLDVKPPEWLEDGLYDLAVALDGQPAFHSTTISYPHIQSRTINTPATVQVRALAVQLPEARIAYIGGGNDTVDEWLRAMGMPVKNASDDELADAHRLEALLESVDTLVIGLFAFRMRSMLSARCGLINQWVHNGGHLLTLYHRPWDNWDPERVPPLHLEIGQPSLRYRVTDQNAEVKHLAPKHPLLNIPNKISTSDWRGWHKERGLYFAKSWDPAYTALLSMADPGEKPHTGSLLSAEIGQGRHTHTSLILHHQMNQLVPGGFRLMANLVG